MGESNDLVKRLDEIQCQVPEEFKDVKVFSSVEEAQKYCDDKTKNDRYVFDGHCFKGGEVVATPNEKGEVKIVRCPVGELLVRCVERAVKVMNIPVHITGEYLTGTDWSQCH